MVGTLIVVFVVTPLFGRISETAVDYTPFGAAQGVAGRSALETLLSWARRGARARRLDVRGC